MSRGWHVTAWTRDAKAVDLRLRRAGVELRHAPLHGYLDPASAFLLRAQLLTSPAGTVVHVHRYRDAFTALLARKLAGRRDVRVVITRHIVRPARDSALYRRMYRNIDAQIFVSQLALSRFLSTWRSGDLPMPRSRLHVLRNSLNMPSQTCVPEPEKGPKVAMYHGRIAPGRGLETLVDALPRLKGTRTRLRIAGTGDPDYVDRLRRRAQARGVMEMIDWLRTDDDAEVAALIDECHFGVVPSAEPEACGMTSIAYMAHGRPHICTVHGAQQEYIADGREALMVPPIDAGRMAAAMVRLASDGELRAAMGARAADTYRRDLSWPHFVEALDRLYCP